MTIQDAIHQLQFEKQNNLSSRFPCRAIMVKTLEQYCQLLSELNKISDIRLVKTSELLSGSDILPAYMNLAAPAYHDEWVILTGVSEYLRLFPKKEAMDKRFAALWKSQVPASSIGRIIIPLWGCETQWYDPAINLNADERQEGFFFNCCKDDDQEQEMSLLVLSGLFEQSIGKFEQGKGILCVGLQEWFEYWENPSIENTRFVLLTKRFRSITPISGSFSIHVVNDILSFIQENMPGAKVLSKDNCSEGMIDELFEHALKGASLDDTLLQILNLSAFKGEDIMGKWNTLSPTHKEFVRLYLKLHPDASYLSHCFAIAQSIADVSYVIAHEVFSKRSEKVAWVEEFKRLAAAMSIRPDADYLHALDAIPEFEDRLDFISSAMSEGRVYLLKMVGQWLRSDPEQVIESEKLKAAFPALNAYLSSELACFDDDIAAYFSRYKAHKLANTLPSDEILYFGGVNPAAYDFRYTLLSEYEDEDTIILWIDALGAEWLSLLENSIANNCDGRIVHSSLAQACLPTETCYNEQWKSMSMPFTKLNKLDKLAHKGAIDEPDYYRCIEEQMEFVADIAKHVSALLTEHRRVVITGDHGTSRLAARFFHSRKGIDAPKGATICSHGRYCMLTQNVTLPIPNAQIVKNDQGEQFAVFSNYDHFIQSGFATGTDEENPIYGEIHGGATPEEMLVSVVVVESNKEIPLTAAWEKQKVKIMAKKARLSIKFNKPVEMLEVKLADKQASVAKTDDGKTWNITLASVSKGKYTLDVYADGALVSLPEVELQSALGDGDGDLP